jgi:hypothetical protein
VIEGFDMFGAVPSGTVNDLRPSENSLLSLQNYLSRREKFLALPHRRFPRKLLDHVFRTNIDDGGRKTRKSLLFSLL